MKKCRNTPWLMLTALLIVLVGCSESEPTHSDPEYANDFPQDEATDLDDAHGMGEYPGGWRPGVLLMKISIHQNADVRHEDDTQGGLKSHAKWSYSLDASQQLAVMVPADFTKLLPDYGAKKIDAALFNEDVYIETADSPLKSESRVELKGLFEVITPNASDYTYMLTEMDVSGPLIEFELRHIRPSMVGKGYEAAIHLDYKLSGNYSMSSRLRNGPLRKDDQECCSSEPQTLNFFPAPDLTLADKIKHEEDESIPPEIANYNQQLRRDFLASLRSISAGQEARAFLHPDMRWKAEPNQLTLSYHSESEHLIAAGGLFSMAAPAQQRSFTVEIIVKAQD